MTQHLNSREINEMRVGEGRDDERMERLRRVIRRNAAHYDNPCFESFLWFPLPNGEWKMLKGSGDPKEWHYHLWEGHGLNLLAEAWNIDPADLWSGAGDNAIPTGYVDFKEERFRDVPFLILPDPLPYGWDEDKVKDELRCGHRITDVRYIDRRAGTPEGINRLMGILKDLQTYRSLPSEPTVY